TSDNAAAVCGRCIRRCAAFQPSLSSAAGPRPAPYGACRGRKPGGPLMVRAFTWLLATVALVSSAMAHGPTRQKVTESVEIAAPADKVWAIVGNFQDVSWHPAFIKTEGKGG